MIFFTAGQIVKDFALTAARTVMLILVLARMMSLTHAGLVCKLYRQKKIDKLDIFASKAQRGSSTLNRGAKKKSGFLT
jgi:hypothetical protein